MAGIAQPRGTTAPVDTTWHEKGLCRDADDTLFYHPEEERGSTRRARAEAAKAICRACPARLICREQSLANREQHGTWGGLSEDERGMLLAGKPIEGPLHDHPRPAPKQARPKTPVKATAAANGLVRTCRDIPVTVKRTRVADPRVVAHVQQLVAAGHKVQDIAQAAGVTKDTVRSVARGSEIVTRRTSALLRAVRPVEQARRVAA
jgi:WhiB family transcriptional regulator, redox-sensing transcriptional regulator